VMMCSKYSNKMCAFEEYPNKNIKYKSAQKRYEVCKRRWRVFLGYKGVS
jgi:hypothetical protein